MAVESTHSVQGMLSHPTAAEQKLILPAGASEHCVPAQV